MGVAKERDVFGVSILSLNRGKPALSGSNKARWIPLSSLSIMSIIKGWNRITILCPFRFKQPKGAFFIKLREDMSI